LGEVQRYMSRLSGPLLDRVDIHVDVPALSFQELTDTRPSGPTSAEVREQVQAARNLQRRRYKGAFTCNAHLDTKAIRAHCALTDSGKMLMETAITKMGLSARAYDKILRVARTLADLEGVETIADQHIAEAVQYRSLDRQLF